jgi:putative ABC transport system permease protein
MSAIGATAGFRRRLAAGQALLVALTGAVLGLGVGLLPGVSMARSLTTEPVGMIRPGFTTPGPPIVDVPWLGLAAVVVGVPLLAALVAAVAVRRRPVLTRRLT